MHEEKPLLVVDINGINFPIALDSLETAEELVDFVRTMHPYHEDEFKIIEARNMPLPVTQADINELDGLQRLIDFNLEDSDAQELILAFAHADYSDPLTWHQYSDIWSMRRAAENALAGKTDDLTEWLFNRFIETRPEAESLVEFLDKEACAASMTDYYTEQDGFIFYKD